MRTNLWTNSWKRWGNRSDMARGRAAIWDFDTAVIVGGFATFTTVLIWAVIRGGWG